MQFQQQVAEFAQAQARELQELKQAAAAPRQAAAPQPQLPPDVDEKLREEMIGNPRRYTAEVVAIAKKQARDEIMSEMQKEQLVREQHAVAASFWNGFYGHNTDLQAWQGEVARYFAQTDPNADPSARANWAAEQVRRQIEDAAKSGGNPFARPSPVWFNGGGPSMFNSRSSVSMNPFMQGRGDFGSLGGMGGFGYNPGASGLFW